MCISIEYLYTSNPFLTYFVVAFLACAEIFPSHMYNYIGRKDLLQKITIHIGSGKKLILIYLFWKRENGKEWKQQLRYLKTLSILGYLKSDSKYYKI